MHCVLLIVAESCLMHCALLIVSESHFMGASKSVIKRAVEKRGNFVMAWRWPGFAPLRPHRKSKFYTKLSSFNLNLKPKLKPENG